MIEMKQYGIPNMYDGAWGFIVTILAVVAGLIVLAFVVRGLFLRALRFMHKRFPRL